LQQEGFTVIIDTVVYPNPKEGWQLWMQNGINAADYVLLICTANYHRRFHKQELKPNIGRGVTWEGAIIYQIFYDNHCQNTKFVPVIAEEDSKQYIPQIFKNWTGYRMYSGFENLVNHLRK